MKDRLKSYKNYEKLMNMNLEQSIIHTTTFQDFFKVYPRIASSIVLERKIERLSKLLKKEDPINSKIKIKREINATKVKLGKNKLIKRLYGESKQEAYFKKKIKEKKSRIHNSRFLNKSEGFLGKSDSKPKYAFKQKISRYLPPSLFNLRELTVSEKGMALKDWLQEKKPKNE